MPHHPENAHFAGRLGERAVGFLVLAIVAVLYAASLLMPALRVAGGPVMNGAELLVRGWEGITRGVLAWYANPAFAVAFALTWLRRDRAAAAVSALALLLAATTAAVEATLALQMSRVPALVLLPGFYVWLAAVVVLFVWSSLRAYLPRRRLRQMADTRVANRD
jgi:hypothetical protein